MDVYGGFGGCTRLLTFSVVLTHAHAVRVFTRLPDTLSRMTPARQPMWPRTIPTLLRQWFNGSMYVRRWCTCCRAQCRRLVERRSMTRHTPAPCVVVVQELADKSVEPMQWTPPFQGPDYECADCPQHPSSKGPMVPWGPWL